MCHEQKNFIFAIRFVCWALTMTHNLRTDDTEHRSISSNLSSLNARDSLRNASLDPRRGSFASLDPVKGSFASLDPAKGSLIQLFRSTPTLGVIPQPTSGQPPPMGSPGPSQPLTPSPNTSASEMHVIEVTNEKKDPTSFDEVFKQLTTVMHNRRSDEPEWAIWTPVVCSQLQELLHSLHSETQNYATLAERCRQRDRVVRCVQLALSSVAVCLNSSSLGDTLLKSVNIGLGVCVGFLSGIESIFKFNKRAYQYAETSVALDGMARSIKTQLLTPIAQRRDPIELILFIETNRDKLLKKLIET